MVLEKNNIKKSTKNNNKISSSSKEYFTSTSKLSRLQRKYCHCLMKVRVESDTVIKGKSKSSQKTNYPKDIFNPYGICYSSLRKKRNMHKTKQQKKAFHLKLNPYKANCLMNYNYYNYSLKELQGLAKELKIPISYSKKIDITSSPKSKGRGKKSKVNSKLKNKSKIGSKSGSKSKGKSKSNTVKYYSKKQLINQFVTRYLDTDREKRKGLD
tara:strand:+ start:3789 stop:4424 length:636 start_codon:yes stop_codon:yes gene_type:complete